MDVREERFTFDLHGRRILAAATWPVEGKPVWGVLIVPGSGPNDVDGNYPPDPMWPGRPHTYRDLARELAAAGVAALRYGRGDAVILDEGEAASHYNFAERPVVAAEAVGLLASRAGAVKRIAVAGHSEGSVVGSLMLSARPELPVSAFISLSGPAWRFYDLMIRQMEQRAVDGMVAFGDFKFPVEMYKRSVEAARAAGPIPEEVRSLPFGFHTMPEEGRRYLREYDAVDNRATIAGLPLPVLIVQGGRDASVFPDNADRLMEARRGNPAPTEAAFFPELDHFYKRAEPGKPFARYDDQEVDPRVAAAIAGWLKDRILI